MSGNEEKIEPKLVIKPKFSILYELIMPTGKKIKNTLITCLFLLILIIIFNIVTKYIDINGIIEDVDLSLIINIIFIILFCIMGIKSILHIAFKVLQYKCLSYKFFNDHLIYEDSFLNQHRKNIEYVNIKEVEIRRTIADRILGYGIIVIYTSAENLNNGLVIYSIKNPQECYDKIQNIIKEAKNNNKNEKLNNIIDSEEKNEIENKDETNKSEEIKNIVDFSLEDEKKFNESLKNINKD